MLVLSLLSVGQLRYLEEDVERLHQVVNLLGALSPQGEISAEGVHHVTVVEELPRGGLNGVGHHAEEHVVQTGKWAPSQPLKLGELPQSTFH